MDQQRINERVEEYYHRHDLNCASLMCHKLRPEGFADDQPPHFCEGLTCRSIAFSVDFIDQILKTSYNQPELRENEPSSPPIPATTGGII